MKLILEDVGKHIKVTLLDSMGNKLEFLTSKNKFVGYFQLYVIYLPRVIKFCYKPLILWKEKTEIIELPPQSSREF